jgi:hypothetical protein
MNSPILGQSFTENVSGERVFRPMDQRDSPALAPLSGPALCSFPFENATPEPRFRQTAATLFRDFNPEGWFGLEGIC